MGAGVSKAAMLCGTPDHLVVAARGRGLDAHGLALARQLRARTPPVSWQHIAEQTGVCEDAVRRAVDPGYTPLFTAAPAPPPPLALAPVRADGQEHRVLWAIHRGVTHVVAIAAHLGCPRTNAASRISRLQAKGCLASLGFGDWALTRAGRATVAALGKPSEPFHG